MSGQAVRWTAEEVLALAPDAASRRSGSRLAAPGSWSEAGAAGGAVWGLCAGSGSKPYQTVVDIDAGAGRGYRCSCPSRKFPCKHALGLLLLWAGEEESVPEGRPAPEWAAQWLDERRARAARKSGGEAGAAGGGAADGGAEAGRAGGAGSPAGAHADPEAARRRAAQRLQRITSGATELEQRLTDLLRGGLAGAEQSGYGAWEETAARMVDAQAPGLAHLARELGAVPASGDGWPGRLLSECALLHLLDCSVLRLDDLPEELAATVRSRIGLTVDSAGVLADESARQRDEWLVLAQRDSREGQLTARRIWLRGRRSGRTALLLVFGAAGHTPELALPVGRALDADLAYYPGGGPLRAALGERHGAPGTAPPPPGGTVGDALAGYGAALCGDPWLDAWPAVLSEVVPIPAADGSWQLADAQGTSALPVAEGTGSAGLWRLAAVSGGEPVTVFGECGHRGFAPYTVWDGTEGPAEAVAL